MNRTYRFECTLCGDCCWGRQVVRLNREDLLLMAEFQGMENTRELFTAGLVEAVREQSGWRPRIRFRTRPRRFCPFLLNSITDEGTLQGLCRLHPEYKPLVCHLSPLGRTVDLADDSETWSVTPPVEGCPGMDRGGLRNSLQDLEPYRDRLDREKDFFQLLQTRSPEAETPEAAVDLLFSWPVKDFSG